MNTEKEYSDHRELGRRLDLFTFSDLVGSGLPLWTPRGTVMRNLLDDFVWELRRKYDYEKVEIPHITKKDLYEKSGHWDKFKDDLFRITTREGDEFALKPMNCPHHTQIYARKPWSYRELPQRYANSTMCYRDEQSGELNGLSRVRAFTQDDAHVFCRIEQAEEEMQKIWNIVHIFYEAFGMKLRLRLSLRDPKQPEKYLGNQGLWDKAESILKNIAKTNKIEYYEALGEAAFYAPKLDFMANDSLGREWQVATIQLDVNMPERFDLTCVNENGEKERIVMIHAAIMGSFERFLSVLIEHCNGKFPLWLSPVQVKILPIGEAHFIYATEVMDKLKAENIRVELDTSDETLGKKIRNSKTEKVPYMLVIGDKEVSENKVTLESRSDDLPAQAGKLGQISVDELISKLRSEIKERK